MKDVTREDLQARITSMRQHLAATEQAVALDSLSDVLLCVADLINEAGKQAILPRPKCKRVDRPRVLRRHAIKNSIAGGWSSLSSAFLLRAASTESVAETLPANHAPSSASTSAPRCDAGFRGP